MKELVHTRDITLRTYDLGEQTILIEGRLLDNRHRPRVGPRFQGLTTLIQRGDWV